METACYIMADERPNACKIGIANNPQRRAWEIGYVRVRHIVWMPDARAAYEVEQETFRRLVACGVVRQREWFGCSPTTAHAVLARVARDWLIELQLNPQRRVVWRTNARI